ncbi:hypothetical protein C7414_110127 [Cupriavidus alkaliphilus]|uniref:hypothetical protein n=1 Tax=Cupriavidus alkaliphilus TaxID=942866 RepID=UPI000DE696A4|nr:hypothetical protein [Cupriavidus alkaliphilus]PVY76129.1 hypothetical protein C7414_110127 [Cupriavidus alkaliphilus]
MSQWINDNLAALNSALALAVLLVVYLGNKFRIDFAWMNLWYSLPLIGKIARLSRDTTRFAKDKSWTLSERTLCDAYKQFIHFTTEEEFNKRLTYLSKAHDLGRSPTPGWMMGLLCVLVLAEGLGFSYMLGTWMAGEGGSENARQLLMWAIVFVLCVIFVFVMHSAGHQLYRSNLIAKADSEWRGEGQPGKFVSHNIKLNDPQEKDDAEPEYKQCVNRVGSTRSYFLVGAAVVIIVFVSVVSTVMRVKHLEAERTAQTALVSEAAGAGNPFDKLGQSLPEELRQAQQKADDKAMADGHAAYADEGLAAFLMLAFIFAITQLVGIAGGYKWGFAGKESKEAYRGTRGFSTYDDYLAFFTPLMQVAQSKLQTLQQKMSERRANDGLRLEHTFDDYLIDARASRSRVTAGGGTPQATIPPAAENLTDTASVLARIDAMTAAGRKADAVALLQSLPDPVRNDVTASLAERKAAQEAARLAEEQACKDEEERNKEAERARLEALL